MSDIHTCSYHCHRPECIKAQRDELRDRLAAAEERRDHWRAMVEEQREQLAAAEVDAARYRWLRDECVQSVHDDEKGPVLVCYTNPCTGCWRDDVDAAIDAARGGE